MTRSPRMQPLLKPQPRIFQLFILSTALLFTSQATAQFAICETQGRDPGDRFGASMCAVVDKSGRSLLWIGAPVGSAPFLVANSGILIPHDSSCRIPAPFFGPVNSPRSGDALGASVVAAGPNRLLVGRPGFDGSTANSNIGGAHLLDTSTGIGQMPFFYTGTGTGHATGSGVAVADVDGDGVLDHIIGSPGFVKNNSCSGISNKGRTVGEVKVYSGVGGALIGRTEGDWHCSYTPTHPRIGHHLAGLGDIDGDGKDEFLIGSRHYTSDRVYVMSFGTGSLARMLTITGPRSFGDAVVGLDDLDGDGAPEFAVGAPTSRQVRIFSGASGTLLSVWTGLASQVEFGATLVNVGDQDGDGHADLLVGAPGAESNRGVAHIYSPVTGNLIASMRGNASGERFGGAATAIPTWVGDARPEIAIGASGANSKTGRVVVVTLDPDAQPTNAYWKRIGNSCAPAGTSGIAPRIGTPNGIPTAGNSSFSISVSETLPSTQSFFFIGASQLPQPFCLSFFGMPSCCLELLPWQAGISVPTVSVTTSTTAGKGTAMVTLPIPASMPPGTRFYVQWYVMDPGGVVAPGTMTSALQLTTK